MKLVPRITVGLLFLGLSSSLLALQRSRLPQYGFGEDDWDPSGSEKAEWAFARLRYQNVRDGYRIGGYQRWMIDGPKAERHFVQGVQRLTRLNARSNGQVADPGSDDLYNWPWSYAVAVGGWTLAPEQAARMREYLARGGFLMVDHFHGAAEWESFLIGMRTVIPDRPIEDLDDHDEIFHVLYDLGERFQVPGSQYVRSGRTYEQDGIEPKWRAIRDAKGRIVVAICHNQHVGDAWQHADDPRYPERFSSMAYRLGINYSIYALTH